jgi:hypothetical protein
MITPQANQIVNPNAQLLQRIANIENQLRSINNTLLPFFVAGRLRTDRTAPTSSSNVEAVDELYDRVVTTSYEYILLNNSGTLEWVRLSVSTF